MGNLRSLARTPTCLVPGIACLVMVTAEQGEKKTQNNYFSLDTHPIISCTIIRHKQEGKYLVKATKASLHDLQLCVCVCVCMCACVER